MNATKEAEILMIRSGVAVHQYWALIPKKRGVGFLSVPIGHHVTDKVTQLEREICGNAFGLEGNVCLETPFFHEGDAGDQKTCQALTRCFGFPVKMVEADYFWARHPYLRFGHHSKKEAAHGQETH
ncbi:MAG: hypothetical protein RLZZ157_80 [Pseudomonadota bacterium]|jgi:hypothetical protein